MSDAKLYENAGAMTKACLDELLNGSYTFFDEATDDYTKEYLLDYGFRSFSDGLTDCILRHGFPGNAASIEEKTAFIKEKCAEKNIPMNAVNIRNWFSEKRPVSSSTSRELVYRLCFALEFSLQEVIDFFLRVYFECPFNFRSHEEVVCCYCFAKSLGYQHAQDLKKKADDLLSKAEPNEPAFEFTTMIGAGLCDLDSDEALLRYIEKNSSEFLANNRTAYRYAAELIGEATKLAKKLFEMDDAVQNSLFSEKSTRHLEKKENVDLFLYMLLGVDVLQYTKEKSFARAAEFPELVRSNFPLRMQLSKIRSGEKVSYDTMRKALILLNFYCYFAALFYENRHDPYFCSIESDFLAFAAETNDLLISCGYPRLYVRNPFDWLIMHCGNLPYPLEEFKDAVRRYYVDIIV